MVFVTSLHYILFYSINCLCFKSVNSLHSILLSRENTVLASLQPDERDGMLGINYHSSLFPPPRI